MTIATFTPSPAPSQGTEDKPKFKLLKADFGDGYTQVARDGVNHIRRVLTLNWDLLTPTQANAIWSFLIAQGGDTPFYYTPSDESTPLKWTCIEPSMKRIEGGMRSISATFEQSFNLLT